VRGLDSVLPLPGALMLSHQEHNAIVKALKVRNGSLARNQMQAHLKAALVRFRKNKK
jgi:DNA-binding FadR family transcriptional regulator